MHVRCAGGACGPRQREARDARAMRGEVLRNYILIKSPVRRLSSIPSCKRHSMAHKPKPPSLTPHFLALLNYILIDLSSVRYSLFVLDLFS